MPGQQVPDLRTLVEVAVPLVVDAEQLPVEMMRKLLSRQGQS